MRALFGSLVCLVLTATQSFALSGGPVYTTAKLVGTYAGVMRATFDPTNPLASNSLAVFSMGIPTTGTGTGKFVMFAQGRIFTGSVEGVGDPKNSKLRAVLTGTSTSEGVAANVNGSLNASVSTTQSSAILGTNATRIAGSAQLNIDQGQVTANGLPILTGVLLLKVSGFKQSDAATTASG